MLHSRQRNEGLPTTKKIENCLGCGQPIVRGGKEINGKHFCNEGCYKKLYSRPKRQW